ncbi:MAG: hypothetical protein ACPG19_14325 [Saprospiraceae bacterium]
MKYLIIFLVTLSSSSFFQKNINNDTCLFEGVLKVKNQFPDGDTLTSIITISKNIVRIDSDNYETIITDYQKGNTKYFDVDKNLVDEGNSERTIESSTRKLDLPKKQILGYECSAYENITEEMFKFGHITQIKTIFWVVEELNSCLYSKYKRLNLLFSNPLDKIALRTERQIVEDAIDRKNIIISEVQEISIEKIDYDLREINNK